MLKLLRSFVLCGAFLGFFGSVAPIHAQGGEKTLGISAGLATYNSGGFSEAYFHCTLMPHIRIAPQVGYVFRNEGKSAFTFDFDVHFPFRFSRGLNFYPIVGFAFNNWSFQHAGHISRAGMNFGGGVDIYLTRDLKLNVQGKYSMMNDTGGGFIGAGIGYIF